MPGGACSTWMVVSTFEQVLRLLNSVSLKTYGLQLGTVVETC